MKRDDLRAFLAEKPYDAMVLTSEISRRYATGFHSTAGAVYLSAKQAGVIAGFGRQSYLLAVDAVKSIIG